MSAKKYGLVLKGKEAGATTIGGLASRAPFAERTISKGIFDSDSEDGDDVEAPGRVAADKAGFAKVRTDQKKTSAATRQLHEEALAEDPSIFDYDGAFDDMQEAKAVVDAVKKEADKERKPKYMHRLMAAARHREMEHVARDDREQQRERTTEGEMYKDKEVFITSAYKAQMELMGAYSTEKAYTDRVDAANEVTKQGGMSGFYRHMLNELTEDRGIAKISDQATDDVKPSADDVLMQPRTQKVYKKPDYFDDENVEGDVKKAESSTTTIVRKDVKNRAAIRTRRDSNDAESCDDDDDKLAGLVEKRRATSRSPSPDMKAVVAETEAERRARIYARMNKRREESKSPEPVMAVRETPKEIVEDDGEPDAKKHKSDDHEDGKDEKKENGEKTKKRAAPIPAEDPKVVRERKLRKMLARRNTDEQIEEARKLFFERLANGGIPIPV